MLLSSSFMTVEASAEGPDLVIPSLGGNGKNGVDSCRQQPYA